MNLNTNVPSRFDGWIEFYDFIIKEIPQAQQFDKDQVVKFIFSEFGNETVVYKMEYIKAQCFQEVDNLRLSEDETRYILYELGQSMRITPKRFEKIKSILLKLSKQ